MEYYGITKNWYMLIIKKKANKIIKKKRLKKYKDDPICVKYFKTTNLLHDKINV